MIRTGRKPQNQHIDPELLRQLDRHALNDTQVGAVFVLRGGSPRKTSGPSKSGSGRISPARKDPAGTETTVRRLLQRVEAQVGTAPSDVNIFRNLGSFVVVAPVRFMRALMTQDEIASVTANIQRESMMIRPRKRQPA